jgi:hypothetical protein
LEAGQAHPFPRRAEKTVVAATMVKMMAEGKITATTRRRRRRRRTALVTTMMTALTTTRWTSGR